MKRLPRKIGPFTLMRELGSDGVTESYAGILDEPAGKQVIVRSLMPFLIDQTAQRAAMEARVKDLQAIRHPTLVPVLDFVQDDRECFVVEDWVDAVDLETLLIHCRMNNIELPHNIYLNLATQICNGLEALHSRPGTASGLENVLHQALRPSGIFVTAAGKLMVGNYGLLRSPTALPSHSMSGGFGGRTEYLSPEQTQPETKLTPASDIFALGTVLYEMLTLEPLFRAESMLQTIHRVRRAEVTAQLLRVKEMLPGLDKVLYRALSLNPRHRYQRAFVLREDLRGLMAGYSFNAITEETSHFLGPLFEGSAASLAGSGGPLSPDSIDDTASILRASMHETGAEYPNRSAAPTSDGWNAPEPEPEDTAGFIRRARGDDELDAPSLRQAPPTLTPADDLDLADAPVRHGENTEWEQAASPPTRSATPSSRARRSLVNKALPTSASAPSPSSLGDDADPSTEVPNTTWFERDVPAPDQRNEFDSEGPTDVRPDPSMPAPLPPAPLSPQDSSPTPEPAPLPSRSGTNYPAGGPIAAQAAASREGAALADSAPPPPKRPAFDPEQRRYDPDQDLDHDDEPASSNMGLLVAVGVGAVALIGLLVCGLGGLGGGLFLTQGPTDGSVATTADVIRETPAPAAVDAAPAGDAEGADAVADAEPPSPKPASTTKPASTAPASRVSSTPRPAADPAPRPAPVRSTPDPAPRPVAITRPAPDPVPTRSDPAPLFDPDDLFDDPEPAPAHTVAALDPYEGGDDRYEPTRFDPEEEYVPPPSEITFDAGDLSRYSEAAYRGTLSEADRSGLLSLGPYDADYTRANVLLYQDAKARGEIDGRVRYIERIMSLPENQYNPQFLTEQAEIAIRREEWGVALERANLAERHWARLPSELIFTRKATIYEIQASAHQGKYYTSGGEDIDSLFKAIRAWEKYQRHVETKERDDLRTRAEDQLVKLYDMKRRNEE